MILDYAIYDVFTDTRLTGNPLAVVFDADQLDEDTMQRIAAEFNLSETIFMRQRRTEIADVSCRIFTPKGELPFAGHPTIGGAIALCERDGPLTEKNLVLEQKAGLVPCAVRRAGDRVFAQFDTPFLPTRMDTYISADEAAGYVGLFPHQIGFKRFAPSAFGFGTPFLFVPVHDISVVDLARPTAALSEEKCPFSGAFVFCGRTKSMDCSFHARMFAPKMGIAEDPATGSAVAALAGVIVAHEPPGDGLRSFIIEQGFRMGRPSHIHLTMTVRNDRLDRVQIGGSAVCVMRGALSLE